MHLYKGANFSDSDNEHNEHANSYYLSFGSFCLMLSVCLFLNISDDKNSHFNETDACERCVLEQLNVLRMKNPQKVMLGHLNINSIPNKFEGYHGFNLGNQNWQFFSWRSVFIQGVFQTP